MKKRPLISLIRRESPCREMLKREKFDETGFALRWQPGLDTSEKNTRSTRPSNENTSRLINYKTRRLINANPILIHPPAIRRKQTGRLVWQRYYFGQTIQPRRFGVCIRRGT